MKKENYTYREVVELLVKERRRAVDIAYSFKKEHDISYEAKKSAGNELAFIEENIADECRLIGNAISGLSALSVTLGTTEKDLIENKLKSQ